MKTCCYCIITVLTNNGVYLLQPVYFLCSDDGRIMLMRGKYMYIRWRINNPIIIALPIGPEQKWGSCFCVDSEAFWLGRNGIWKFRATGFTWTCFFCWRQNWLEWNWNKNTNLELFICGAVGKKLKMFVEYFDHIKKMSW